MVVVVVVVVVLMLPVLLALVVMHGTALVPLSLTMTPPGRAFIANERF